MSMKIHIVIAGWVAVILGINSTMGADWPAALSRMPLGTNVTWLTRTNCAETLFAAFSRDAAVKALIFMPGATDELYFFHRVNVQLVNPEPNLFDAIKALTNQSPLRVAYQQPLLLIYSDEDVLDLEVKIEHPATVEKLKAKAVPGKQEFLDRDWKVLRDHHRHALPVSIGPLNRESITRHFYRHTFAGWELSGWETLQATALAGKTQFTVRRGRVEFDLDERMGQLPRLERFPN